MLSFSYPPLTVLVSPRVGGLAGPCRWWTQGQAGLCAGPALGWESASEEVFRARGSSRLNMLHVHVSSGMEGWVPPGNHVGGGEGRERRALQC